MSSTFENTLFDFDLDFLNQPVTSNVEHDEQARSAKLRRQVCKIKKKVKWVDENVESFILANKTVDEFRVREIQLQAQCKQQLVEIGTFIEKVTGLQNEIAAAETRERQKDEKILELENQIAALKVLQTQIKALQFEKNNVKNELVETRRKDKTKILNMNKENEKLRKENARIPSLEKEIERLRKESTLVPNENLIENNQSAIQKLEKEIDILREENTKISKLEKEIDKKNAESLNLEKEVEILRKENSKILMLEKEIETLNTKNTGSLNLEKEIEILRKENAKISMLEKEIETFNTKNAGSSKLAKEIENLQKEYSKIPKMTKEIEHLRKENAKIIKLGNENENLLKQNSNLEKDLESLRIKNAKIEMENKAFIIEIDKIRNEKNDIETRITHLTSTTKGKGKLLQKKNKLSRKHKSLPDRNGEWCVLSKDKNYLFEDPLSPTPHDTIIANKSPIGKKHFAMLRERDHDNSIEVASEDTGRGSSLANSDTDKSLHSPEYFLNFSHPTGENIENKTKAKDASMLRGSIHLEKIDNTTNTTVEHDEIQKVCEPISMSRTKAANDVSVNVDTLDNTTNCIQGEQEKECNSLQRDSHTSQELLHIFNSMRLNFKSLSPIPSTPEKMHEVDSTSELNEKISRCSLLCKETAVFLIQLEMRLGSSNHSFTINNCDRLIASLDSVLKSEQTLNADSTPNTNPNMQISNCVLSHDDNSLVSIPELTPSSPEKGPDLLQSKKTENRLSQNRMFSDDNDSVIISNPPTPDMETNTCTQAENRLSMDLNRIFNHPDTQDLAMNNEIFAVTASVRCDDQSPIINTVGKKSKYKKVTKLGKLKKKLEPKYKIRIEKTPPRNLRIKPKQLIKKNVSENDTSASLNNKDVYEKAVKVMAELNSKQGIKTKTPSTQNKVLMSPKRTTCLEVNETSASPNNKNTYENPVEVIGVLNCQQDTKTKLLLKHCNVLMSPKRTTCLEINDTSASLNNKDAYEKAVKVMGELNSQQRAKTKSPSKQTRVVMTRRRTTSSEKDINSSGKNQLCRKSSITCRGKRNLSDLFDNCSVVLIKDPLLLSPLKSQNSTTTNKAEEGNDSTTERAKQASNYKTDRLNEDNDSTTNRANGHCNSTTDRVIEDIDCTTNSAKEDCNYRVKQGNQSNKALYKAGNSFLNQKEEEDKSLTNHNATEISETCDDSPSRKKRRRSSNEPFIQNEPLLQSKKDKCSTNHNATEDTNTCDELPLRNGRRRSSNEPLPLIQSKNDKWFTTLNATEDSDELPSRKRRRRSSNEPHIEYKRVLRSATINTGLCIEDKIELSKTKDKINRKSRIDPIANENDTHLNNVNTHESLQSNERDNNMISYGDFDIFSEEKQPEKKISAPVREVNTGASACHPTESILCYMLEKHGVETVKAHQKKIPENTVKQICEKIEQDITLITESKDNRNAMINFVDDLRKLHYKHFIAGLMMFLAKPERKTELFGKVNAHPAPPMTKTEQVLLYAIHQLEAHWPSVDIVDAVLSSIEFTLFKLNRTPDFGVIESTSHFYAILCRYVKAKSRLRLFMLDAMYCIQFKSVPLIKQCLEVWMHTIPLSHLGMAKTPLVTCLVYLLHFYKCKDRYNRVHEIRKILRDKYYYQITDWNEAKILEMFKNSLKDLKDISIEKKMLRLALIILGKRQGPQWCQKHIVKSLLQPMIEKNNVPNYVKEFCVSMIGPLMKPYPVDMKVHCEIAINQLVDILNKNPSPEMEEAAMTSMIYINRHDQRSINKTLLSRKMKPMSLALEKSIRDYVKTKPLKIWKINLAKMAL